MSAETAFELPEVAWSAFDQSGYAAPAGVPELREEIAEKLRDRNGVQATADQVVVTTGASGGLLAALSTVAPPGSVVSLPDPGYPGYRGVAELLGLRVVHYPATADLVDELGECIARVSPAVVVVNSPANPSGRVLNRATAEGLGELARRSSTWLISDEVYEDFVFDGGHVSLGAADPQAPVIGVYSLSKSFGMAGWRIGYVCAPRDLAVDVGRRHWSAVMSAPGPAQVAARLALRHGYPHVERAAARLRRVRTDVYDALRAAGLETSPPEGGIFFWVRSPRGLDGAAFAQRLWEERRVAVQGGGVFGPAGRPFFRLSFGAAETDVFAAVERISDLAA